MRGARVMQHRVDGIKVRANSRGGDFFYRRFQGMLRIGGGSDFARLSVGKIISRQPRRTDSIFLAPSSDEHAVRVEILRPEGQGGKGRTQSGEGKRF